MTATGAERSVVVRRAAVAGSFYPAEPGRLRALVTRLTEEARRRYPGAAEVAAAAGILVPHAGLQYSGIVAAAGWLAAGPATTVVVLGTNHRAGWLRGIGAWHRGAWRTPLGDVLVDEDLADAILALGGPFEIDLDAHREEHSIEVQLPLLRVLLPDARLVPLAVSTGTGLGGVEAGARLGRLLAAHWGRGERIVLAISSDMAHYPPHDVALEVTSRFREAILDVDPGAVATRESALRRQAVRGLACGMCGIEPAVVGLAALRAAGVAGGIALASATSADAGGPEDRTVGYFAAAFGLDAARRPASTA